MGLGPVPAGEPARGPLAQTAVGQLGAWGRAREAEVAARRAAARVQGLVEGAHGWGAVPVQARAPPALTAVRESCVVVAGRPWVWASSPAARWAAAECWGPS